MEFTRRALGVCGVCTALVVCGVVFDSPVLLFGSAGVGAWLVGRLHAFVNAANHVDETLTVRTQPSESTVAVG